MEHPGELTIRHLLENYKPPTESRDDSGETAEVWQRPPTADIESREFLNRLNLNEPNYYTQHTLI